MLYYISLLNQKLSCGLKMAAVQFCLTSFCYWSHMFTSHLASELILRGEAVGLWKYNLIQKIFLNRLPRYINFCLFCYNIFGLLAVLNEICFCSMEIAVLHLFYHFHSYIYYVGHICVLISLFSLFVGGVDICWDKMGVGASKTTSEIIQSDSPTIRTSPWRSGQAEDPVPDIQNF